MDCINLRAQYGDRYIIRYDESRQGSERDPWLQIIPAKLGDIYPFGGTMLAASIDGFPRLAAKLAAMAFVRLHQSGDDGTTIVFEAEHFDEIAEIMQPKKRRILSPVAKAELASRLGRNLMANSDKKRPSGRAIAA